jgi:hypothetical protein
MVEIKARLQELADAASRAARAPGADRALRRGRRRVRVRVVGGGAMLAVALVAGAVGADRLGLRTGSDDGDGASGAVTSASATTVRPLGSEAGDIVATGASQGVSWTVTFKIIGGPDGPTEQLRLYAGLRRAPVATLDSPLAPTFFLDDRTGWDAAGGHAAVVTPQGRRRAVLALASQSSGITRIRYELIRPDATVDVTGVPVRLPGKVGQVFVAFGPTEGSELYVAHLNADDDMTGWISNMVCATDGKPLPRRPKHATEAELQDFRRQMAAIARQNPGDCP